jgi:hypothetical protein
MPVFIEPATRARTAALLGARVSSGVLAVGLGDSGTQRLDPQNVRVAILDGSGAVLEQRDATANYVLPGRAWYMNLKLPTEECRRAALVSVTWPDLAGTSLTHPITTGSNACEGSDSR